MNSPIDLGVVVVYLVGIVGIGCLAGRRRPAESGANRYFMAAHSLRWPTIGLALFATNISCVHLVSLAQAGYDQGLLMGNFEWMAAFTLILLALFFVPFYLFVVCVGLQVALTLLLPKEAETDPERLHWQHPLDALRAPGWPGLGNYKLLSVTVAAVMIGLYATFH